MIFYSDFCFIYIQVQFEPFELFIFAISSFWASIHLVFGTIDDVTCDITCLQKSHRAFDFLQARFVHSSMKENIKSYILWKLHCLNSYQLLI